MRLVGTTKSTIEAIRDRTHWNASTLAPMDPVTLGLCSQIDLDFEVQRAAKEKPVEPEMGRRCCRPKSPPCAASSRTPPPRQASEELNVQAVFAKLKQIGGKSE